MEWVETTGSTLEEAQDRALDELGIDESEAEFEVLEEPKPGLFGRTRGQARVRARVAPKEPRPKAGGRTQRRRGRSADKGKDDGDETTDSPAKKKAAAKKKAPAKKKAAAKKKAPAARAEADPEEGSGAPATDDQQGADDAGAQDDDATATAEATSTKKRGRRAASPGGDDVSAETIAEQAKGYLEGLVDAMGYEGVAVESEIDENEVLVRVDGGDLGLLIGPKGATLQALQDLTRLAVRRPIQDSDARLHVDVSGYREKRREALGRWVTEQAQSVLESNEELVLEPMSPADRKVVHDAVNEIDGVSTVSEGREGSRYVVILPD